MWDIGLTHYLVVSCLVFGIGAMIVMMRRNAVAVLMGVEMILNAAALNFVAFGRLLDARQETGVAGVGQVVGLFIVVAAAAEAAIALAIVLNFFNRYQTINLDEGSELKE
ncbi:NADH-quinone oxidoreductase subunit NuoK [bacterium]|nr:NADH-quinone oxidoreductase subunit NuoK [bacterium]